jgi:teichuronic acid biosynthesis glycosyltransferase TuaG
MIVETIIPTLNDGSNLIRAVRSALAQEEVDPPLVIVVDNGSTDNSIEEVLALKERRVRVIECTEPGAGPARNVALDDTSSRVIAFLDGDDVWHPNHLSTALLTLRNTTEPTLYSAPVRGIDQSGNVTWVSDPTRIGQPWGLKLLGRNRIAISGVVISGAPFQARFTALGQVDDLALWLRLFREGFAFVGGTQPTVDYAISPPRYPGRLIRKNEWVLYREFAASDLTSHKDRLLTRLAISVGHIRSLNRQI